MAQDVYRQAADRPTYELSPMLLLQASVSAVDCRDEEELAPVARADDELAPVIFDEDVTAAAGELYDHRLVHFTLVGSVLLAVIIVVAVVLTRGI